MASEERIDFLKSRLSDVKNKEKRKTLVRDLRVQQRKDRIARRKQRVSNGDPKEVPRTIESMREPDNTEFATNDEEVFADEGLNKISTKSDVVNGDEDSSSQKVLLTCSVEPSRRTRMFCRQLAASIPNCDFRWRRRVSLKSSTAQLISKGYTSFVVVTENREEPAGILVSRLPDGPTARFRLSSVKLAGELHGMSKQQSARCAPPSRKRKLLSGQTTEPAPQVLLNNFSTRLGLRVSTLLSSIFSPSCTKSPSVSVENGRVLTFHNQRDFIFFRQHRFGPSSTSRLFRLNEVGPRFTLKLRSLQPTTFDCRHGEFEWLLRHHEMETSRHRFFL